MNDKVKELQDQIEKLQSELEIIQYDNEVLNKRNESLQGRGKVIDYINDNFDFSAIERVQIPTYRNAAFEHYVKSNKGNFEVIDSFLQSLSFQKLGEASPVGAGAGTQNEASNDAAQEMKQRIINAGVNI